MSSTLLPVIRPPIGLPPLFHHPEDARSFLLSGGILVYPTETFYAIGCLADNQKAAEKILRIKQRLLGKTLPLLAGSTEQAEAAAHLEAAPRDLLEKFWPGPLTILLPAKPTVCSCAVNNEGLCAVRVSANPEAARLAGLFDVPLVSTSANISGENAVAAMADLHSGLFAGGACGLALWQTSSQANSGLPSTIIQLIHGASGTWTLKIIRKGLIDKAELESENWTIQD